MKLTLFYLGCTLLLILGIYSISTLGDRKRSNKPPTPINSGYFLVVSACFLGAALTKEPTVKGPRYRFEIYRQLSKNPQSVDDLVKALDETMGNESFAHAPEKLQSTIATMIDERHLECHEGLLKIPK